jgi:hypothetical protein
MVKFATVTLNNCTTFDERLDIPDMMIARNQGHELRAVRDHAVELAALELLWDSFPTALSVTVNIWGE